LKKASLGEAQN